MSESRRTTNNVPQRAQGRLFTDISVGVALTLTLLLGIEGMALIGWDPANLTNYRFVAVLSGVAWAGSGRFPLATLAIVAVISVWPWWNFDVPEPRVFALAIAGYRACSAGTPKRIVAVGTVVAGVFASTPHLLTWLGSGGAQSLHQVLLHAGDPSQHVLSFALVVVATLFGVSTAKLRRATEEARQRGDELLRLRDAERERAIAEERTAMSRDIHDLVAHHVTAIVVRAQAAELETRAPQTTPESTAGALAEIQDSGRRALTEMRRVVGALRRQKNASGGRLRELLQVPLSDAARMGLTGEMDVPEDLTVPDHVGLTLIRIVQEAITNTAAHSTASRTCVRVRESGSDIIVSVIDNGELAHDAVAGSGGFGIPGMRERAELLGGRLHAGPDPSAPGWRVQATFPRASVLREDTDRAEHPRPQQEGPV